MSITSATTPTTTPAVNMLPQASLQGLPQELRDKIYAYLRATEEGVVQGRRFVELRKNESLTLDECFRSAVSQNPLSMTCRQMLKEYDDYKLKTGDSAWAIVVNNFDITQLELFSEYVDKEDFFYAKDETNDIFEMDE